MAPAMSIRCMTVPPRMNPSGLASFGRTTWVITEKESAGLLGEGVTGRGYQLPTPKLQLPRHSQLPTPKPAPKPRPTTTRRPAEASHPDWELGRWECLGRWPLEVGSYDFA